MEISSLIENLNLNFNRAVFNIWDTHSLDPSFELNPRDFLYFAKDDITSNSVKGLANSLTNAKRAIDCQIDLALAVFGINYDKIPKLSNPIVEICGLNKIDIPYKFKLMQALDFAPGQLVSKIRMKRHRLEHYYKKPNKKECIDLIEIAELFIGSVENKLRLFNGSSNITDKCNYLKKAVPSNFIEFGFDEDKMVFNLYFHKGKKKLGNITLSQNDKEYYGMIKLINNTENSLYLSDAFICWLQLCQVSLKGIKPKMEVQIQ